MAYSKKNTVSYANLSISVEEDEMVVKNPSGELIMKGKCSNVSIVLRINKLLPILQRPVIIMSHLNGGELLIDQDLSVKPIRGKYTQYSGFLNNGNGLELLRGIIFDIIYEDSVLRQKYINHLEYVDEKLIAKINRLNRPRFTKNIKH